MANKNGSSDFWMKKSTFTDETFNDIYVSKAIDIEKSKIESCMIFGRNTIS